MKKKVLKIVVLLSLLALTMAGCSQAESAAVEEVEEAAPAEASAEAPADDAAEADEMAAPEDMGEEPDLAAAAEKLGITEDELTDALGDPPPDLDAAAEALGISKEDLVNALGVMPEEEIAEAEMRTETINSVDFEINYELFTWDDLPADVVYERQPVQTYTDEDGVTHSYEAIYVESGNLNWYQAANLAQDAGGYLASINSEGENEFVFEQVSDEKYFWCFEEDGDHYGICIGPFLGGYQPEGAEEPDGGWSWLSGEAWEYENWAVNLDDGVIDLDPRDGTQPNDSGDEVGSQQIMGFGEMNLPVATWGDYMDAVGTYGETKLPGYSYGFIIEYETEPAN